MIEPLHDEDDKPAALHEHAFDNLRFIRETMARAGAFTDVSGWAIAINGFCALLTTWLAWQQQSVARWLSIWLAQALLGVFIGGLGMARKARKINSPFFSESFRRFFLAFSPPLFAGAAMTAALFQMDAFRFLPGVWMLLYGAAVMTGGAFSIRIVPIMGLSFMVCGLMALFVTFPVANLLLAISFGLLHIIFGLVIARRYGG